MAATYKPNWAFDYCKDYVKQINLDRIKLRLAQNTSTEMWMAAPWRWTLGALPIVTLAANTQDYSVILPADFLYVETAYMTQGSGVTPLEIVSALPATTDMKAMPNQIAVTGPAGGAGTLRVMSPPGDLSETFKIICMYKKKAPVLTLQQLDTAGVLGLDDEWSWVFDDGVLLHAYLYADDPRAGSMQVDNQGKTAYTGQAARFQSGIQAMRRSEKLPDSTMRMAPTMKKDEG